MAFNWRVYGKDTVACRLDRRELPGWLRKNVVVGPGEAAMIVRDGRVVNVITESKAKVQGALEGLSEKLFGWLTGRKSDVSVMFFDTSPLRLSVYVGQVEKTQSGSEHSLTSDGIETVSHSSEVAIQAVTLDKEIVSAECLLTLVVSEQYAPQLAGLMKGRDYLSKWDLAASIRDELLAKVLVPRIASHKADELRGNRELAEEISTSARSELAQSLTGWGFSLTDFTISWGLTETEALEIREKRAEREEEAKTFAHQRGLAEMQRDLELQKTRIENLGELKQAEAVGDEKLKDLYLTGELRRDTMVEGQRVNVAKVDAEVSLIRLDVEKQEGAVRLEIERNKEMQRLDIEEREFRQQQAARLSQIDAEDKEMRSMVEMQIQMATSKHEREMGKMRHQADAEFRKQQADLTTRFEDRPSQSLNKF